MGHAVVVDAEPPVRSQDALCGICGAQYGIRTGFSSSIFFLFCHCHSSKFINLSSGEWTVGPLENAVPDSLTPSQENEEKL
jgi:hypothetical protein